MRVSDQKLRYDLKQAIIKVHFKLIITLMVVILFPLFYSKLFSSKSMEDSCTLGRHGKCFSSKSWLPGASSSPLCLWAVLKTSL